MLRNLFLIVPFLLLVHVTSAVALPACPGSYDNATWTNCEGAYVWSDGRKYEGEFDSGKFHGQGTYTFVTGSNYVGEFKDGRYDGQGTHTFPNDSGSMVLGRAAGGLETVGEFADNFPNGHVTLYWPNGDVWVGRVRFDATNENGSWLGGTKYLADNVPPDLVRR